MKDKYFNCIDLFIVNVDRTNPLATCMYHHLFNLKKYWMWLQHLLATLKLQIKYVAKK